MDSSPASTSLADLRSRDGRGCDDWDTDKMLRTIRNLEDHVNSLYELNGVVALAVMDELIRGDLPIADRGRVRHILRSLHMKAEQDLKLIHVGRPKT